MEDKKKVENQKKPNAAGNAKSTTDKKSKIDPNKKQDNQNRH